MEYCIHLENFWAWFLKTWTKTREITKTRVIKDSQDGRPSVIGSSIMVMKIMVMMRGVGPQSSRAGNQTGSLSWAEIGFH